MTWLARLAAVALLAAAGQVLAQAFPSKPITLICPWPPGGSTDTHLRRFAEIAAKYLRQPVIIENKPGAGGILGPSTMAATAKPDGYTLAQYPISLIRVPLMQKSAWDPISDFTFIIGLTGYTFGVVVKSDSPYGIVGPKGMDPAVVRQLHDAFRKVLDDPEHLKVLQQFDQVYWYKSSEDFARWAADTYVAERATLERVGLLAK